MMKKDIKVAVLGAGAMGCLFGGLLSEKGLDVVLIDVWKEHVDEINSKGLKVMGHGGDRIIQVKATVDPKSLKPVDAIIIMCKATALEQALNNSKNIIGDNTMLMSFQNGIGHEEIMQRIAGKDKVLGGSTTQASSIQGPGIIQNHASLPSWIGEYDGGHSQRVKDLAETFTAHGLETIAEKDIKRRKWMKLFALTAIGPLSAIFDLHHTDLYISNKNQKISRNLGKNIILETREVARADGVEVSENDCLEMFNRIVDSRQTNKSSMAFDVLKSRITEIDFISGAVSKIGKKYGIKTPLNDLMYNIIKIKEGTYS
ncbi:MAG: hypothetical protein CL687_01320 [Candidatus Pelagibacter sp.]|nr:hypothetical protein [Candidatus Pelagibacter sp.]OUW24476.1 MAG: hypothetical protein CBD34_00595 [Rickettsiales bacterium TMED174]|tara:strand:+ start:1144 stop:2088 length:945 start_codon:yes stop_codon:yes gene_type:complete